MSKVIRHEIDLGNLPALTAKQRAELQALAQAPEAQINYEDQPQLSRAFLKDIRPGDFGSDAECSTKALI